MKCYVCQIIPLVIVGNPEAINLHLASNRHLTHIALNEKLAIIDELKTQLKTKDMQINYLKKYLDSKNQKAVKTARSGKGTLLVVEKAADQIIEQTLSYFDTNLAVSTAIAYRGVIKKF